MFCVPKTPTVSSLVVTPPSTYLCQQLPSLPGVCGHCPHCGHLGQPYVQSIYVSYAELSWRTPGGAGCSGFPQDMALRFLC